MHWSEIPQFITHGSWECNYSITSFIKFIEEKRKRIWITDKSRFLTRSCMD